MKTFDVKSCPLCGKTLYQKCEPLEDAFVFNCPFEIEYQYDIISYGDKIKNKTKMPHYLVRIDSRSNKIVQQVFIIPYRLESVAGTGRTKINKWSTDSPFVKSEDFIVEVPFISPIEEQKLLQKVRTYVLFS